MKLIQRTTRSVSVRRNCVRHFFGRAAPTEQAVIATRNSLEEYIGSAKGPGLEGAWADSPMPSFWDHLRKPVGFPADREKQFGPRPYRDADGWTLSAVASHRLGKVPSDNWHEADIQGALRAFQSVSEAITENDDRFLHDVFGNLLSKRYDAWRKEMDRHGLGIRVNVQQAHWKGSLTAVSLVKGNTTEAIANHFAIGADYRTAIPGLDLDFHIRAPLSWMLKLIPSVESFPIRKGLYGFLLSLRDIYFVETLSIARWQLLEGLESAEIYEKTTGKVLWSQPAQFREHIWKFATIIEPGQPHTWKLYDMDNVIQDSIEQFLVGNGHPSQSKFAFDSLINEKTVDENWWIESRKVVEVPLTNAFSRSVRGVEAESK